MTRTLKDIIKNSTDLYEISVLKKNNHDRSTWEFVMKDPRWTDPSFKDYTFKTVHLRRGEGFFLAFKSNESNAYFVDLKRSMYRKSVPTYVGGLVDYSVKTNDISITKDKPSFRVTMGEMKKKKIDNFLDLCYTYRDYTAIGTGYTRNIRNLVVMDIDVDCTKPDNNTELNNLLLLFAKYNSLPDFYIFNNKSNHVQLQWLIKDLEYKDINNEVVNNVITELINSQDKNCEVDYRKTDFTQISELGVLYRRYTMALCDIIKKRKFGDKNYTFWKAKNPMSALIQKDGLELRMPYYEDGEIQYRSDEEMNLMFSTKEERQKYFNKVPDLFEWYDKLSGFMDPLVEKITEKKAMKIEDAKDVSEIKDERLGKKLNSDGLGKSRNTYVLNVTRLITNKVAKEYGCRTNEDFRKLPHETFNTIKKEVYSIVYSNFKKEDEKYGGIWPETSNISSFTPSEFKKAFDSSFTYAVQNINDYKYSDENRRNSILSRGYKKSIKLFLVDKVKNGCTKITRKDLLKEVNRNLKKLYISSISMGSLKRYIAESNELTDDDRIILNDNLKKRKEQINSKHN